MGKMTAGTRECPTPCKDRETSSTEDGSLTRLSFRDGRIAPGDRGIYRPLTERNLPDADPLISPRCNP